MVNFGQFWVQSVLSDVTKGVKILKFGNSDLTIVFLVPKSVPNHFSVFIACLVNFGPFWVQSGHSDVTKGGKILKFGNSDFTIDFLVLKNVPMPIFRSNQSCQCVLWCFWSILGRFGYKRGSVTSQRESRFYNFEILTLPSAFSSQKTYPCQFLEQNQHFFVSYCILGEVLTIFSYE